MPVLGHELQAAKVIHDPVAPTKRSAAAQHKTAARRLDDGTPAHSFTTLKDELSTIVRNTYRPPISVDDTTTFKVTTQPNPKQRQATDLIQQITL